MKKITVPLLILFLIGVAGFSQDEPGIYAQFTTEKTELTFRLDYTHAPLAVISFILLAESEVEGETYDGTVFSKVIPGYAILGGSMDLFGFKSSGEKYLKDQTPSLSHDRAGILSMRGDGKKSDRSRFLITLQPDLTLDRVHTPFGVLVSDVENLEKIKSEMVVQDVSIHRVGAEAEAFSATSETFKKIVALESMKALETFGQNHPLVMAYVQSLGDDVRLTDSGIFTKTWNEGSGRKPLAGETVRVHYTGSLTNGMKFDSSRDRGQPFDLAVGTQSVIPGWDEILLDMKEGESRTVIIPPEMAYGNRQAGPIPPESWLVFEIELLEISP